MRANPADGWIELFDGKSLAGWYKNPMKIGHGTGGNWQVEDGTITGEHGVGIEKRDLLIT